MKIEELSIKEAKERMNELKELSKVFNQPIMEDDSNSIWEIGKNYFIRTVTFHYTGKLKTVTDKELVFEKVCWIADDGRFTGALKNEEFDEVEVYPDRPVILGRGAILDAIQITKLPNKQK